MAHAALRLLPALAAALALQAPALAQSPPIKPGLWSFEMSSGNPEQDAKRAEAMKKMATMPPDVRARMEAMMKQNGVSMDGSGAIKVCYSKRSLDSGAWTRSESNCKTDFGSRSGSSWKWHVVCPDSESEGEAVFKNFDSYAVNITTTRKSGAEPRTRQMHINGHFLNADCGDMQPIEPKH